MTPNSNVRAGDEITFNAAGSSILMVMRSHLPGFGDGNTGSGLTTTHSYVQDGEYTVRLTVSDGSLETTTKKTLNIIDPSAREPKLRLVMIKQMTAKENQLLQGVLS